MILTPFCFGFPTQPKANCSIVSLNIGPVMKHAGMWPRKPKVTWPRLKFHSPVTQCMYVCVNVLLRKASYCFSSPLPSNDVFFMCACVWACVCVCVCVFACAASFINAVASLNQFLHRSRHHAEYCTNTPSHVLGDVSSILLSFPSPHYILLWAFLKVACHLVFGPSTKKKVPLLNSYKWKAL